MQGSTKKKKEENHFNIMWEQHCTVPPAPKTMHFLLDMNCALIAGYFFLKKRNALIPNLPLCYSQIVSASLCSENRFWKWLKLSPVHVQLSILLQYFDHIMLSIFTHIQTSCADLKVAQTNLIHLPSSTLCYLHVKQHHHLPPPSHKREES